MTDKVHYIAHLKCYDSLGKCCYFSKRTICNPSIMDIYEAFMLSTIPIIQKRLPEDCKLSSAELYLFSLDNKLSLKSYSVPNYVFKIQF